MIDELDDGPAAGHGEGAQGKELILSRLQEANETTGPRGLPGRVSGIDKRGYVKTTEGFGHLVRSCPDARIWTETLDSVKTIPPNDWRIGKALVLLDADKRTGRIHAEDPRTFVGTTSYIGVYVHRLNEDTRLIEVTAQWKTRMTVTENPWEGHLLAEISRRLYECIVPPEQAIIRLPR